MKKFLVLFVGIVFLTALPLTAGAVPFTMNATQLQSLYVTCENPVSTGTYLSPVQAIDGGAKFTGNVRTNESGWGTIQIGANFWGQPFEGNLNEKPTNVDLGLGSLEGYDAYALTFKNGNENPWMYQLNFNVGYTDLGEADYYVENTWTSIDNGKTGIVTLDFTDCHVWKNGADLGWVDLTTYNIEWDHVSNIGFQIGGNMPVGPNDYTFETEVSPVPEPATMLLFGTGLIGLAGIGRKRFFKKA